MTRFCLTTARLASAMWVGAALLFVATSVTEQVHPTFDADTKDMLALIRFPWYYGTGATLLVIAFVSASQARISRTVRTTVLLSLAAAGLLMAADYTFVYRPMRDLLSPPGPGRGPAFDRLHAWSEWLNVGVFLMSAAAALMLCAALPLQRSEPRPSGSG